MRGPLMFLVISEGREQAVQRDWIVDNCCDVADYLTYMAEAMRHSPPGPPSTHYLRRHVRAAGRYALKTLSTVWGVQFGPDDVQWLVRGFDFWKAAIPRELRLRSFAPTPWTSGSTWAEHSLGHEGGYSDWVDEGQGSELQERGDDAPGGQRQVSLDAEAVLPVALKSMAALLDLVPAVRRFDAGTTLPQVLEEHLGWAFDRAIRVVSTLLDLEEWDPSWPEALAREGRGALQPVLDAWTGAGTSWMLATSDLDPLRGR